MGFRWDWMHPHISVPYLPTLGPLHPEVMGPELLNDVFAVADTGEFLPHDKDRRWSDRKEERVLVEEIIQDHERTLIPTITGRRILRLHLYGASEHLPEARETASGLAARHRAAKARVVWFQRTPNGTAASTRIQLRAFDSPAPAVDGVEALSGTPAEVAGTFGAFAEKLAGEGFAFLNSRLDTVGPVLVVVRDGRVAGAIGPMETMADPIGRVRLLPQYFGVLPDYRGLGLGRWLWRAAMHWGREHGADYQLLQTTVGGASDHLCRSEGLTDLGIVCTSDA
ncbi:GNAT family N-acetyltransferase [Kitasatospora sp. NPDC004799]|uniref:GNAT family N-acetyltransferase n=1 Tax=Kitasatospora sp. NPDC004799 TaxID=3154460 RepID=UPI0033AFD970